MRDNNINLAKYYINTLDYGVHLIINNKGENIIINSTKWGSEYLKRYSQVTGKYKIYDKDIMKDMKLFEKQLQKKQIYQNIIIYNIYISYYY